MERTHVCDHEQDVVDLTARGGWPDRADDGLREHVRNCTTCRDLACVAEAIHHLAFEMPTTMPLRMPDARLVWHRAQMQARRDASRRAARPVVLAERAALAITATVLLAWASGFSDEIRSAASGAWHIAGGMGARVANVASAAGGANGSLIGGWSVALVLGVGLGLLAAAFGLSRLADRSE